MTAQDSLRFARMRRWELMGVAIATVSLMTFLVAGCLDLAQAESTRENASTAEAPGVPVVVAPARAETRASSIQATGTVVSRNDARLAAEVAGLLEWIAEPGAEVAKGQPVARINAERLELALRDNEAAVRRLDANRDLLATQRDRLVPLAAQNIASRSQIDEAQSRVAMAEQELEQARVARDRARLDLRRAVIRAPFDGHVAERVQQVGEYVDEGTPLARLVDTRNVEVVARAPLSTAVSLARGQSVSVDDGARSVASTIRSVVPVGDERSRLLEVRVVLAPSAWPIGAPVRVGLSAGEAHAAVTVPRDAVVLRQGAAYIYRVGAGEKAERIAVKVGAGRADRVEVVGMVVAGDRIVVRGAERLQPGQKVAVKASSQEVMARRSEAESRTS